MTHIQGPVPLNDNSYIERPFELNLLRELTAGRWSLLLGPRQHGKTSALLRIKSVLADGGFLTALVDLQSAPPLENYDAFIGWVCKSICGQVGTAIFVPIANQDLGATLATILPAGNAPVAVLIDEASNIRDVAWRNAFYGQLRAISSRRAFADASDYSARLRFVFAGTFRPETLIDEANSPFNVCERFNTDDLSENNVIYLANHVLGDGNDEVGRAIFSEVGGQPFLVQKLLNRLERTANPLEILSAEIDELRLGDSDHVANLFGKVLAEPKLASIAARMVSEGAAPMEAADPDFRYMQVLGIARRSDGMLVFRNDLYSRIAATSPQLGGRADADIRAPMFALPVGTFGKVQNAELREIAWSMHSGTVAAYRSACYRLALAGFGGSLEAILLDLMLGQSVADLTQIAQRGGCRFQQQERQQDPKTWRLVNLIKAAHLVSGSRPIEPPQALREWRNQIHPSVAMRDYRLDALFEPEARLAAVFHEIALRDLP